MDMVALNKGRIFERRAEIHKKGKYFININNKFQINILEDVKLLDQTLNLRPECIKNFRIAENLLKAGAEAGLTLFDIGCILYREER